jgi:Domain of unknown function (DUF222)
MVEQLERAIRDLRRVVAGLEPERFDGGRARELVDAFSEVERLGAAGKALAARRVAATGAWKQAGAFRDAADWLADATGATVGQARATLDTAERLESLPSTEAALRSGTLSCTQAQAIADAATADPHAELALLARAHTDGVRGLRNECARVKSAACIDENAGYERIRATRSLRHWTDPEGAGHIDIRGPVDATARVLARLVPYERELFENARADGRRERSDALAFDALVALADAPTPEEAPAEEAPAKPRTGIVIRIDHTALTRGHTEPGEICEIAGSGPIPVAVASRMLDDAFVKAVVVDGTDVLAVSHLGRTIPARLRTAIEELYPECCLETCNVTHNLEIDHNEPVELGGPTALWNLGRLCPHHHWYKHHHDLRLAGEGTRKHFVKTPAKPSGPTSDRGP